VIYAATLEIGGMDVTDNSIGDGPVLPGLGDYTGSWTWDASPLRRLFSHALR
jgi:hypothetical protein